ncbi:MAG: hypothetical protein HYS15_02905 [Candidatus Spechtbacteria bacterium]|nr:hypothetical protein [Candidatus Spechtbacteria bacterium]
MKPFEQKAIMSMVVDAGILGTACIAIGSLWDTFVHIVRQHSLLEPAHLFIIAAAFLYSVGAGLALLAVRKSEGKIKRCLWCVFTGGTTVFVSIVIFDEIWHIFFGLETSGWSPPHLLFWIGILVELWGLVMLAQHMGSKGRLLLISAAMISILMFLLLQYDVPAAAGLAQSTPGFTYPVTGTAILVTGLMLLRVLIDRSLVISVAAIVAWLFFWLTGRSIEALTNTDFLVMPFPVITQAVVIDWWFSSIAKTARRRSLPWLFGGALFVSAVSYWSIVAWAGQVTQLPHQLSGGILQWMIWFWMLVPATSLISGLLVWRLSSYMMPKTARL